MYDIIVIGAGVAGMTSALNILRNGKNVLVIEQSTIGGQIASSPRVENFPTIDSISGSELSDRLLEQILSLGAEITVDTVSGVSKEGDTFTVTCEYDTFTSKSVIIASGVKPRMLGMPNEEQLIGHGVSYCAMCDGAFYKDEPVALIGDGNTALQYALFLSNMASHLTICTLFDRFFADQCHLDALATRDNVTIIHNTKLDSLHATEGELSSLHFTNTTDNSTVVVDAKAVFVAIGHVPDNDKFSNLVTLDSHGHIIADDSCTTKTPGLFVAGDCRTKSIRQLSTAVGDGCIAGISASAYTK